MFRFSVKSVEENEAVDKLDQNISNSSATSRLASKYLSKSVSSAKINYGDCLILLWIVGLFFEEIRQVVNYTL